MKLFEHPDFEQLVLRAAEHFKPRGLRPAVLAVLGPEYEAQCEQLCYRTYPSWDQVRDKFEELKGLL